MIPLSLGEIADIVDGRLADADPATVVTGPVEYDSRRAAPGGLFLALPGERVDGHDFVSTAYAGGAVAALVTRPVAGPRIEVADGIAALSALAAAVHPRLAAITVGITGSSGKTSTKDLIAHVLAAAGPTVAAVGSANNELGFPYTVLRAEPDTRFLVLELGARGRGHIQWLTTLARPRIGAVLNVGSAHLGEFGSREAIAVAKGELVEALPADGVAVLNADDPLVAAMAERTGARVAWFSAAGAAAADVRATDVRLDDGGRPSFRLHTADGAAAVRLQVVGAHQVSNALAAAAVAGAAGLDVATIAAALAGARAASQWRMAVSERPDGVVVVNDAYNANPESMRAALDALVRLGATRTGRTYAVLGEMAELGPATESAHAALGADAAALGVDQVLAIGAVARPVAEAAGARGRWFADAGEALVTLRRDLRSGDVVLVKASRAASLERLALALVEDGQAIGGDTGEGDTA